MDYYEDIYKKRVNRFGTDFQSRLIGEREYAFENYLKRSVYTKNIMYDGESEVVLQEYVASKPAYQTKDMFFEALVSPFLHIYRRELLVKSGVKFTQGYIYEDTAFYLNLIPRFHFH